ncbi:MULTISPECIES: hypothetical protein [unclassified Acidovorax]|uniref:hypothetical protein n=1 Tax=unclassified Acidovorax TaxID=2684926 RepID=UPI0006F2DBC2|nr:MULTISPECIES: hypothetical protein [unclassified Acidovorax]KRB30449.1 hypothetical protein ASD94_04505 [Acidovorax sp. Root70]PUA98240.1 hypothetical protein C8C99_3108 [Acidovorax sp. 107]
MTTPEAVIASYLDHIQDEAYIEAALARHGAAALVDAAVRLVRSLETERFDDAVLFIRDVSIGLFQQEITLAFRALLPGSGLFDALDRCLRAPAFHIRSQAAYTFGKLSYPDSADRLIRVLEERRDTDPLLAPQLLFEIRWLRWDDEAHWRRIQWLAEAPEDVCRWAALQAIEDTASCPPGTPIDALLAALQNDRFDYIRAEATGLRNRSNRQTLTPQEPMAAAKHTPMAFRDLSIRFWHHHTAADYTPADLRAFLAQQAPPQGRITA